MGNRPREGDFTYDYHRVAKPGEEGMRKWMEEGDPSEMVSLREGSPDSWSTKGIKARIKEYGEILRRMKDRRLLQYPKYKFTCLAHDLKNETDREGNKKYKNQEEIAEEMSKVLVDDDISPTKVSRALADYDAGWKDWNTV